MSEDCANNSVSNDLEHKLSELKALDHGILRTETELILYVHGELFLFPHNYTRAMVYEYAGLHEKARNAIANNGQDNRQLQALKENHERYVVAEQAVLGEQRLWTWWND